MRRHHRLLVAAGLLAPACSPAPTAQRASTGTTSPLHPLTPADEGTTTTAQPEPATTTTTEPMIVVSGLPPTTEGVTTTKVRPRPLPTTTLPELADDDLDDETWWARQPGAQQNALLACIRSYEQGEAGYATDTGNGFYGAYQFDLPTWRSVGGSGNPAHASPGEQDARAWALYQSRGLAPWPTPARRCG